MRATGEVGAAVSVAAFKRAVHIIEGVSDDDLLIADLLRAAQDTVETATRRPMTARAVEIECRATGYARWWFPVCPVVSVASVQWQGADGAFVAMPNAGWRLEMAANEPVLVFAPGAFGDAPSGAVVRVTATVGHDAAGLPRQLAQAVILLAKEWMDAGIALEDAGAAQPGFGVRALMRQVRYMRPAEFAVA